MKTIRCQNVRYKRDRFSGALNRKPCGSILCQVEEGRDTAVVVRCGSCNTFFLINVTNGEASATLLESKKINFNEVMPCKQIGVQVKGGI